ncbi:hypothetical protein [Pseudonocardia sp. WMMC193]|uniref:hypothetical protein n=1 Tax=Pseudonocardia sp. WMMC193 TaxID=2911965 RepID=UPI001F32DFC9|nr:hypothetical protein [Pseudonocardia sp. WMMC193]MCF7548160.1 hypothetical protein [Pseudonocardia sp. WMMC193]
MNTDASEFVPAWLYTSNGAEHVTDLPIPATDYLSEREAVVIGVGSWDLTDEQRAYGAGKFDSTFPGVTSLATHQARGY